MQPLATSPQPHHLTPFGAGEGEGWGEGAGAGFRNLAEGCIHKDPVFLRSSLMQPYGSIKLVVCSMGESCFRIHQGLQSHLAWSTDQGNLVVGSCKTRRAVANFKGRPTAYRAHANTNTNTKTRIRIHEY